MRKQYDVAVIGGGPAGYVAAIKAAQLGGRAAVFEKSVLGGTCLNRGCIPTKCYLKTAELMEEIAGCTQRGIVLDAHPSVDLPKAVAHKNSVVKKLTEGVAGLLRSHKIDVYYGEAALATENTLTCGGETYGFDSVLLCGGSKPGVIPIPGAESKNVLDSDALLDLEALPRRLAIIGGGVIGCEMAAAFHGFGSQVTVIEAMDRLVPPMDEEISAQLKKSLEKKGIRVLTSQKVSAIQDQGTGSTVLCQDGTRVEADKILICVGRAADLDCLGALKDRIRLERGKVSAMAGEAAFRYVEKAIRLAMDHEIDGTVTNAINKEAINLAGHHYSGHTEIYADMTQTKEYTMMLAHENLRVVHVSTHVSLREACDRVKNGKGA